MFFYLDKIQSIIYHLKPASKSHRNNLILFVLLTNENILRMESFFFTAIKDGVDIKGYTSRSLLDKFEWEKYGFYYIEFNVRNKPRYPKASVQYYKEIITANGFPNSQEVRWYP